MSTSTHEIEAARDAAQDMDATDLEYALIDVRIALRHAEALDAQDGGSRAETERAILAIYEAASHHEEPTDHKQEDHAATTSRMGRAG